MLMRCVQSAIERVMKSRDLVSIRIAEKSVHVYRWGSSSKDVYNFWTAHVDRKCAVFHFDMPWRFQICLAKCLFSYADDLAEDMGMFAAQECKTSSSCWRAFPQKRPCLSSVARSKTEKSRINLLLPWRHWNSGAHLSWNPADLCSSKIHKWLTPWVFVV